jgi:hypothetical protein
VRVSELERDLGTATTDLATAGCQFSLGFSLPSVTGLTGLDRLPYRPVTNQWV